MLAASPNSPLDAENELALTNQWGKPYSRDVSPDETTDAQCSRNTACEARSSHNSEQVRHTSAGHTTQLLHICKYSLASIALFKGSAPSIWTYVGDVFVGVKVLSTNGCTDGHRVERSQAL